MSYTLTGTSISSVLVYPCTLTVTILFVVPTVSVDGLSLFFHDAEVNVTPSGTSTKLAAISTFSIVASLIVNIGLGLTATREIVFSALLPFLSKTVTLISFLETVPKVPVIVLVALS